MKILFMGTPDFAVPCLQAIIDAGHEVIGVVTQPDRPKGRGHKLAPTPVKVLAMEQGLDIYQPEKVKAPEFVQVIQGLKPDCIVVVAFGQLLSKEILELPPYGCINVHASLLPRYRGAAPLHWVVINGEKETGVTTMYMDVGLDTGDMILKTTVPIDSKDTVGIVHDKLAATGGNLLNETLRQIEAGAAPRVKQDDSLSNYASMLNKEHEIIHWEQPADKIYNQIRGMNPWPGAYTLFNGKILKLWAAELYSYNISAESGTIAEVLPQKGFVVMSGTGGLLLTEVQLQGSKKMSAPDFMRGNSIKKGIVLRI